MLGLNLLQDKTRELNILCLGAHSDDLEIGCGGTILTLASEFPNCNVYWVVFSATDVRAREASSAAKLFLSKARSQTVLVKDFRDGFFPFIGDQIKESLEAVADQFSPDIVFTHYRDDRHQDHRLVSDLTWNTFRGHLVLEYEIPKYDGDLGTPNFYVPLSRAVCDEKVGNIIRSFASQNSKQWFTEDTFFSLMRLRGIECAAPVMHAEAFYARKLVLDVQQLTGQRK